MQGLIHQLTPERSRLTLAVINVKMTIVPAKTRVIVLMITIVTVVTDSARPYLLELVEMIAVAQGIVIFPKVERLVVVSIVKWMRTARVKHLEHGV